MYIIRTIGDLKELGINYLTGEADRLSFRILCDITTPEAVRAFQLCHGLMPMDKDAIIACMEERVPPPGFSRPWNSGVCSVLIDPDNMGNLITILLFEAGHCHQVVQVDTKDHGTEYYGYTHEDQHTLCSHQELFENNPGTQSVRTFTANEAIPGREHRATHMMSGRTL